MNNVEVTKSLLDKKIIFIKDTLSRKPYARGARVYYDVGGIILHCDIKNKIEIISSKCVIVPDFNKEDETNVYPSGNALDIMSIRAISVCGMSHSKEIIPPPNKKNLVHCILQTL